jgi:hypothetical protein
MRNYMKKVLVRYKILIVLFAVLGVSVAAVPVVLGIDNPDEGWSINPKATEAIMSYTKLTPNYKTPLAQNCSSLITQLVKPSSPRLEVPMNLQVLLIIVQLISLFSSTVVMVIAKHPMVKLKITVH